MSGVTDGTPQTAVEVAAGRGASSSSPGEARLAGCVRARASAATALERVLGDAVNGNAPVSEAGFRDAWVAEMRKQPAILPTGWYGPPPDGVAVLFATDADPARVHVESLRTPSNWPRNDRFLDREHGLVYLYASPVDSETGMIGDPACTLYLGSDPGITDHLRACLALDISLFHEVAVGMTGADLFRKAMQLHRIHGWDNHLVSPSDPAGTNIGHTIPASLHGWTEAEVSLIRDLERQPERVRALLSARREFLSPAADTPIEAGMGFTIEPRPSGPGLPMASYHTIVLMHHDGGKELVTGFDRIFEVAGMNGMCGLAGTDASARAPSAPPSGDLVS